jgi:serine protease AprX
MFGETSTRVAHRGIARRARAGALLLVALLLMPLVALASPPQPMPLRAQPILLSMAAEQPDETLDVIVQQEGAGSLESLVTTLGGQVTQRLPMINAFAARLPAGAVRELAQAEGLRWVSLNAPVAEAQESGEAVEMAAQPSDDDCDDDGMPNSTDDDDDCDCDDDDDNVINDDDDDDCGCDDDDGAINHDDDDDCGCYEDGQCIDTSNLRSYYVQTIGADEVWNNPPYLQGQGIAVAVVDSGVRDHKDIQGRAMGAVRFNRSSRTADDGFGHGTHVAGIVGGDGKKSDGAYIGVAPEVNLISVKVGNDRGGGTVADTVAGMQWILNNKDRYNIRVVNLSLNSMVAEAYDTSPLNAAVEILWFNGIVVVTSSGNNGVNDNGILYPPANDPFVISVGATDDKLTADPADDTLAPYSAFGTTESGFSKPEIVAPGHRIISLLGSERATLPHQHQGHVVNDGINFDQRYYFRMSGTSMAAAVTSGAVALLLQDEPNLTPDQVKYRLMATARPFADANTGSAAGAGAGMLDIYAAVNGTTTESANTGTEVSELLWDGAQQVGWDSINWGSINWGSINWGSINWGSINWGSINWGSINWGSINWGSINWG